MSTQNLHHPHDKLFKKAFSRPRIASSFLKQWIPQELSKSLQWKTLQVVSGNFIDERFQASQSDLLYKVYFRQDTRFLLILLEHQSKEDPRIWYRLIRYIVSARESASPDSDRMIPVIPMVLSQSSRSWMSPIYLKELFNYPERLRDCMDPIIPNEKLELIELCVMPYKSIQGAPFGAVTLKVLKAKMANELLSDVIWHDPNLLRISASDFRFLLTYILSFKGIDRNQISHKLDQLQNQPIRKKTMTALEQIQEEGRQEGIQKGLKKGLQKGQTQVLQALLRRKFRSIPRWADKHLKSATTEDLIRWSERVLYKDTLKEVFE